MTSSIGNSNAFDWGLQRGSNRTDGASFSRRHSSAVAAERDQSFAAAGRSNSTANFDIRTAEGDRVTISVSALSQFGVASRTSGSTVSTATQASSASQVQVKIEGDLSDAELKDITDLIGALGQSVSAVRSGKQTGASALARSISGLSTLTGFDFAYRQQVQASTVSVMG
jgi:hypothetical protein